MEDIDVILCPTHFRANQDYRKKMVGSLSGPICAQKKKKKKKKKVFPAESSHASHR